MGKRVRLRGKNIWPYIFVLPFFIIYLSFGLYPLIYSFFISLTQWDGFSEATYIGFDNYINIFTEDPYFLKSIGNTLILMVFTIPLNIAGGIGLAVLINSKLLKGKTFFRLSVFSPYLTIPVAIGIIFSLLFDWNSGVINNLLIEIGIIDEGVNFLGQPWLARSVVILMNVWKYMGYYMIFFSAGLLGIPTELYEAAEVDGASALRKFWSISMPLLRPITEFLTVMSIIWGFQFFDEPNTLFSGWTSTSGGGALVGGPQRSLLTAVWNLYDTSFGTQMQYGKGAAIAYGLFLFILTFSLLGFFITKRNAKEGRS